MTTEARVPYATLLDTLRSILEQEGMQPERASLCARLFADASRDGVPSHGLNRFAGFVATIRSGQVKPNVTPTLAASFNALERYDAQSGPGPSGAHFAMARACGLAQQFGIGCVALGNSNHWMRAGNYGWQAADAGCIGICFTNGSPVMAPWGTHVPRLGNNPLVIAVPRAGGAHVVLDTALSQFSWGRLKILQRAGQQAPLPAGYSASGELTTDPAAVLEGGAILPIGYWKGAGIALLVDIVAASLANGLATCHVAKRGYDHGVSQTFIAIDPRVLGADPAPIIDEILADLHATPPTKPGTPVLHPGERTLQTRAQSMREGVPVDPDIWQQVLGMRQNLNASG
jgi:3-dehydro-L-gulonate 2-dehydrogenase